jgi:hypothetical protein
MFALTTWGSVRNGSFPPSGNLDLIVAGLHLSLLATDTSEAPGPARRTESAVLAEPTILFDLMCWRTWVVFPFGIARSNRRATRGRLKNRR